MRKFKYFKPESLEEAISTLSEYDGKAKIVAGGTDVLHLMKNDCIPDYPEVLVDIKAISGLSFITEDAEGLKIGAATTLNEIAVSSTVQQKYAAIAEAAKAVASPHIRKMGTIGGNICQEVWCWYYRKKAFNCLRKGGPVCYAQTGDNRWYGSIFGGPGGCYAINPSDTATALVAFGASVKAEGPGGERTIAIGNFFKNLSPGHILEADEVLTEIQVPTPEANTKSKFLKLAIRKAIDFALVNSAVKVTTEGGVVKSAGIALGGVFQTPRKSTDAEASLVNKAIDETSASAAAEITLAQSVPMTMNAYKVTVAKTLVNRAILACK